MPQSTQLKIGTLILLLTLISCRHIKPSAGPTDLQATPQVYFDRYPVRDSLLAVEESEFKNRLMYTKTQFRLTYADGDAERVVKLEFYRTKKGHGPRPTSNVVPIRAGSYVVPRLLARWAARRGYNAVIVKRPTKWFRTSHSVEDLEQIFRGALSDHRSVLAWLRERPEVDKKRMGIVGTSLGAFTGVMLAALEPQIKMNFLLMGGQDFSKIILNSEDEGVVKWVAARMALNGMTKEELRLKIKEHIISDPLAVSKYIDPKKVVQVITKKDKDVPAASQWELWESLNRPEAYVFPVGHYTMAIYLRPILRRFKKHLKRLL